MITKKQLAILLSQLQAFSTADEKLEQYPTDSEIAADALWSASMLGDIHGKVVADLGAGTGVLGLGALLLGARKAMLVDVDESALALASANQSWLEQETGLQLGAEILRKDVQDLDFRADVVFMNPPFGTRKEHADTAFLLKAMTIAPVIYSFHKASTREYIDSLIRGHGFVKTHYTAYDFPLKQTMGHHTKRIERISVGLWRIARV